MTTHSLPTGFPTTFLGGVLLGIVYLADSAGLHTTPQMYVFALTVLLFGILLTIARWLGPR